MDKILYYIEIINGRLSDILWGSIMLIFILAVGLWFSIRLKFFPIIHIKLWIKKTFGVLLKSKRQRQKSGNGITPFQAMTTALAGAIGTGNIVGVATAITMGGAGAIVWMWIASILGMATIFVENILGVKYREKDKNNKWIGGPMYYIEKGLKCKPLAIIFAIACTMAALGMGNMTQSNSIADSLYTSFGISKSISGFLIAIVTGIIILGGIKRIASITEKIVPFMAIFYILGTVVIILVNIDKIPSVIISMFSEAFNFKSFTGGSIGYGMSAAIRYGVSRGVFSNEAGLGSSPIVHAAADTDEPVEQGMWGIFQVFIDTIVVCTLTALCILCTWNGSNNLDGAALSTYAFSTVLGNFGSIFMAISILLFAFATLISWEYFGEKSLTYITKGKYILIYKAFYVVLCGFGAVINLRLVWSIADTLNGLMCIPNLIAILLLSNVAVAETKNYLKRKKHID